MFLAIIAVTAAVEIEVPHQYANPPSSGARGAVDGSGESETPPIARLSTCSPGAMASTQSPDGLKSLITQLASFTPTEPTATT